MFGLKAGIERFDSMEYDFLIKEILLLVIYNPPSDNEYRMPDEIRMNYLDQKIFNRSWSSD